MRLIIENTAADASRWAAHYVADQINAKAKTSHTLNRVPCIIYDNFTKDAYTVKEAKPSFGLSNVAATTAVLLGYKPAPEWDEALIETK